MVLQSVPNRKKKCVLCALYSFSAVAFARKDNILQLLLTFIDTGGDKVTRMQHVEPLVIKKTIINTSITFQTCCGGVPSLGTPVLSAHNVRLPHVQFADSQLARLRGDRALSPTYLWSDHKTVVISGLWPFFFFGLVAPF